MSNLDEIKNLLPDNTNREITEKDLRDSFELAYDDINSKTTIEITNALYLSLLDFTILGKIRADKIEALGLTDLIEASENSLAAFVANSDNYEFQQNDFIAVPVNGNFSLYMYKGGAKTAVGSYLPTGLTNITIAMVEGLQDALNGKLDKPSADGNYFVNRSSGTSSFKAINPGVNYLLFWNGTELKNSSIFRDPAGVKFGIGTEAPTEQLHLTGRARMSALFLEDNAETLPQQITYNNRRFFGTDITGNKRSFMYADYSDYLNLIQGLSPVQKDNIGSIWNSQYSVSALSVSRVTPPIIRHDILLQSFVLTGANLNINTSTSLISFIPLGEAILPDRSNEIPCNNFTTFADGRTLIVFIIGNGLAESISYNVLIRTISPTIQTHRTTSSVKSLTTVTNVNIGAVTWERKTLNDVDSTLNPIAVGGSGRYEVDPAVKPFAGTGAQDFAPTIIQKSSEIFNDTDNFSLEGSINILGNGIINNTWTQFSFFFGLMDTQLPLNLVNQSNLQVRMVTSGGSNTSAFADQNNNQNIGFSGVFNFNWSLQRDNGVLYINITANNTTITYSKVANASPISLQFGGSNSSQGYYFDFSIQTAYKY